MCAREGSETALCVNVYSIPLPLSFRPANLFLYRCCLTMPTQIMLAQQACAKETSFIHVYSIWWNRSISVYIIEARSLIALSSLCVGARQVSPTGVMFRNWLSRLEAGRGAIRFEVRGVYLEYHASHLMRLFLRTILIRFGSAVIAGGYPAAMYAEMKGYVTWRPRDVDIFFFDYFELVAAQALYDRMIARPLGRVVTVRVWNPEDEDISFSNLIPQKHAGNSERNRVNVANVFSRIRLKKRVVKWLSRENERMNGR